MTSPSGVIQETMKGQLMQELRLGTFLLAANLYSVGGCLLGLCPVEDSIEFPGEEE
jgi:hypothetical protein